MNEFAFLPLEIGLEIELAFEFYIDLFMFLWTSTLVGVAIRSPFMQTFHYLIFIGVFAVRRTRCSCRIRPSSS